MELLITIIIMTLIESSHQQTNYCDSSLCRAGTTHIACNSSRTLSTTCGVEATEIVLDSTLQALILGLHNGFRSTVATGNQSITSNTFYPQAKRMATVVWSTELADIAGANTRRCIYGNDQCRNTATFTAAGQNIAIMSYFGRTISTVALIKKIINKWYEEYAYANPTIIASFPSAHQGHSIGHFTQIVGDRVTHLGCSLVVYYNSPWTRQYFVCDYSLTNIIGQPVYKSGDYCSECTTGCSTEYPGLCTEKEIINSNP
ncbi:venom allergen 5.01-like [Wyeomyia smithii]|uniref:venom allergen 5.01-like n=1 Tax=Wyeomyia smithii TaxID=174621 RepID=UPI0024680C5A|nr:venom allergen 5.01-like [Wyeomyia smithii]